jgi:hypothetical protein
LTSVSGDEPDQRQLAELEEEHVRGRVDAAQRAVELERARARRPLGALGEDDLEGVAGGDVLARAGHALLVVVARREAAQRARRAGAARERRHRAGEQVGDLVRVAAEHLRHPAAVVEADEDVRDHEEALRGGRGRRPGAATVGSELGGVVVAQVADDRLGAGRRLVEGDEPRAGSEQRVAAEPTLLHRLEQEARPPGLAYAEVAPRGVIKSVAITV